MAVYKVIQDIEAEDRLVGPLTLKGFVYAGAAALLAFISVRIAMAGSLGIVRLPIILIFLPPIVLFGVLALPLGREQPTESWLLSRLRFYLKSRKRVWDQSGQVELVTITAPKRSERQLTKDLSQTEVKSRLKALAMTLDTRGWAVRNVDVDLSPTPAYLQEVQSGTDRLVDTSSLPSASPSVDIQASDDIMDEKSNATAKHFESLMQEAETDRKNKLRDHINSLSSSEQTAEDKADFQFMYETSGAGPDGRGHTPQVVRPTREAGGKSEEDPYLSKRLKQAEASFKAARHIEDSDSAKKSKPEHAKKTAAKHRSTDPGRADKLNLAQSGNVFRLSTLSKMANRKSAQVKQVGPNEVEIDLH